MLPGTCLAKTDARGKVAGKAVNALQGSRYGAAGTDIRGLRAHQLNRCIALPAD